MPKKNAQITFYHNIDVNSIIAVNILSLNEKAGIIYGQVRNN